MKKKKSGESPGWQEEEHDCLRWRQAVCWTSVWVVWNLWGQDENVNGCLRVCTGNVMVERTPISFSPFPLVDCTLVSHFSFNDFVAVAFPDLAGDLDAQI